MTRVVLMTAFTVSSLLSTVVAQAADDKNIIFNPSTCGGATDQTGIGKSHWCFMQYADENIQFLIKEEDLKRLNDKGLK